MSAHPSFRVSFGDHPQCQRCGCVLVNVSPEQHVCKADRGDTGLAKVIPFRPRAT